jgi:membrane fusion protein, multidrug efflux system
MELWRRLASRRAIGVVGGLIVLAFAVIAIRLLDGGALALRGPDTRARGSAIPVTAAKAVRQDVPDIINTIGTVQSIDQVAVQSQVSGPITKIEFQPGQEVKKDQELFLIDPRPFVAALDQAKAQLAHDQAVLSEAQIDLVRYQTLAKENSIAKQQAQDQAFVVDQDKGTVALDQANVDTAQINLGYCHIKSPIDGRAGILLVELGNLVGPQQSGQATSGTARSGTGTPSPAASQTSTGGGFQTSSGGLVSITQIKPIYVTFPVAQTVFDLVRQNQAAGALDVFAYSQAGKMLGRGKLTVIGNQVDAGTGTVAMQGTFANADEALWPGEFVRVELVESMRRNVVTVPAQAIMEGPSGSYVYSVGNDQMVHRADVQVTSRDNGIAVIAKGVSEGERVVTDGQYRLADGAKVAVQQTTEKGAGL